MFLRIGLFWEMCVRAWCLGQDSSRWDGAGTCCRGTGHGAETSSPSLTLDHVFVAAENMCFGDWEWHLVLERFYNPSVNGNGQFQMCCCPRAFYMRGLCTGSEVDAWSLAPEMQHFRNLGAMKKFGLTRWGGNSKMVCWILSWKKPSFKFKVHCFILTFRKLA